MKNTILDSYLCKTVIHLPTVSLQTNSKQHTTHLHSLTISWKWDAGLRRRYFRDDFRAVDPTVTMMRPSSLAWRRALRNSVICMSGDPITTSSSSSSSCFTGFSVLGVSGVFGCWFSKKKNQFKEQVNSIQLNIMLDVLKYMTEFKAYITILKL